ncbi:MAG: hypothetical protein KAS16_01755 [Thermoplasmata archaeon]|nr:hypothetical protein [Thermoplasmata archaeon]
MPIKEYLRFTPHGMTGIDSGILMDDPTYIDEKCKIAIQVIMEFARKNNIDYKLYSIKNDWPLFCAWIEGVKVYPTIIIGKNKIEGIPRIDELENMLNS